MSRHRLVCVKSTLRLAWYAAPVTRLCTRHGVVSIDLVVALLVVLAAFHGPSTAHAQEWVPYGTSRDSILEGNWQSCRQADGRYAEKIYDHVVNGVPQFEFHMGPGREFALFAGSQEDHRDHLSSENLLAPFMVPMEGSRARHTWTVPSLGVTLTVSMGGGSLLSCDSWYVSLTPLPRELTRPRDPPTLTP